MGDKGWNCGNGGGVLFNLGTDKVFPQESYDLAGPMASLRLKLWRRGIQGVDRRPLEWGPLLKLRS